MTMSRFNNQLKTFVLLAGLTALIMLLGRFAGGNFTYVALGFAALLNVGAYFFSDKMVLALHRAREVTPAEAPQLHRIVEELAQSAQIPKPRVCVMPSAQPNAFATGRNPAHGVVAVTDGILSILNERELRGVLAHEIAHIKNRDILIATIAAVVAAAISHLATGLQWMTLLGGSSNRDSDDSPSMAGGLVVALIAPFVAMLIQFAISRSREYLADEAGATYSKDPEALASALEKLEYGARVLPPAQNEPATASLFIVSPFAGTRSFVRLFSTHPETQERVRRLRAMA